MNKKQFHFSPTHGVANILSVITGEVRRYCDAQQEIEVEIRPPRRTLDANAAMWATLSDIARQVDWTHSESGQLTHGKMTSDSWKAVLTAAFEKEIRTAAGVNSDGYEDNKHAVMLGARSSQYSRAKMGDFIAFVHWFGAQQGVRWSARAQDEYAALWSSSKSKTIA